MNRFRTKRKARKGQVEPKPELDLAAALPSTDDFRTSLIMPNLSARFSMLREQDDPSSKLGKASDDSVLQPKRQSRLPDFGFRAGLSDIAEVSSINSSIRPPFTYGRQDSVGSGDGYGTDEDCAHAGSVMSRARLGEANVLFGGRQKIYKIPAGPSSSTRSLGNGPDGGMSGRALYDDDVGMSAFQKLRQQARQDERERQEDTGSTYTEQSSPAKALTYSSSISNSSRRRETTCSTNSGPSLARSSTAATSIASQGPNAIPPSPVVAGTHVPTAQITAGVERSATTKTRRLYEQGLHQHIQDQQSSTMTRLNSVQRQRMLNGTMTPPYLSQTKSSSNLNDRYQRTGDGYRAASPPPSAPRPNLIALNAGPDTNSSTSSPIASLSQEPPLSPAGGADADEGNVLSSAIQPSDRGKATAMGAFNKPRQFDEQQYLQRQLQLQQGKTVSPPTNKMAGPSVPQTINESDHLQAVAGASHSPEPDPLVQNLTTAFSVFQKAANRMRSRSTPTHEAAPAPDAEKTFLASLDGSESEDDIPSQKSVSQPAEDHRPVQARTPVIPANQPAPSILEHPALRELSPQSPHRSALPAPQVQVQPAEYLQQPMVQSKSFGPSVRQPGMKDVDSPTLGPTNGGLSGLVRQHLRNTSNQSSISSNSPMTLLAFRTNDLSLPAEQRTSAVDTTVRSSYTHSNPWDLEDLDGAYHEEAGSMSSVSPGDAQGESHATYRVSRIGRNGQRHALDQEADVVGGAPWVRELHKQHSRGASTETQQEREAFLNEVAQRQRAIQESLKSKVEGEIRSQSPTAGVTGAFKAFGILRAKSSRDSVAPKQDPPLKAMKMLGLGSYSTSASNVSLTGFNERLNVNEPWRSEVEGNGREANKWPTVRPLQTRLQSDGDQSKQQGNRNERDTERANSQSRSPPSSDGSTRNRSSSEISGGRSRSRTRRFRDDSEEAVVEATGSRLNAYSKNSSAVFGYFPDGQIPSERTQQHFIAGSQGTPAQSPKLRSNSKTPATSYLDQSLLHPVHTAHEDASSTQLSTSSLSPGLASRASPVPHSPALSSSRPSPVVAPYSLNSTPPMSTATTPLGSVFANTTSPLTRLPTHRKQSIKKSEISEPTFISMTSVVDTVDLPPGASLKNGQADPPPLPPINPLRKRFGFGRSESQEGQAPRPSASGSSNFSSDENDKRSRSTQKLRKTSSEGWSLNINARKPVSVPASPSLSQYTNGLHNPSPQQVEGAMF